MPSPRLLLVDDDESIRTGLKSLLEASCFQVATASGVAEALHRLAHEPFDVLVSDLYMPDPGDGLTVVSAMRHSNPAALTILFTALPDMTLAASSLIAQVDEIVTKPASGAALVTLIHRRLATRPTQAVPSVPQPVQPPLQTSPPTLEAIAALLERDANTILQACRLRIAAERTPLHATPSSSHNRPAFDQLDHTLRDIIFRLRNPLPLATPSQLSLSAHQYGARCRRRGESPAVLAEEMRIVHAVLAHTMTHLVAASPNLPAALLPTALALVADELHAQLAQGLAGYAKEFPIPTSLCD